MDRYTDKQKTLIVNNIVNSCKNIDKLNNTGYKFIYLASGFIAHYDLQGFKAFYSEYSLRDDIINNARFNQWNNFKSGDRDYEYYMDKKDIYNRIVSAILYSDELTPV
jgi:hypothetical protein